MSMADAAYDVLRGASDGRALTNRQIAEIAVKRRLVRGELADVSRSVRVALVREQRHRDSEGFVRGFARSVRASTRSASASSNRSFTMQNASCSIAPVAPAKPPALPCVAASASYQRERSSF